MNIVNLVGRLAKDPVARDRSDTRITELILVTERPVIRDGKVQKDPETGYTRTDAEFHKITVFNGMGLPLREHKSKGDQLAVSGRLHTHAGRMPTATIATAARSSPKTSSSSDRPGGRRTSAALSPTTAGELP